MIFERVRMKRMLFVLLLLLFAVSILAVYLQGGLPPVNDIGITPREDALVYSDTLSAESEKGCCMGVPIAQAPLSDTMTYAYADYSEGLLFGGRPVPMDKASSTIYISQDITQGTSPEDLMGTLELPVDRCKLYFAADATFDSLYSAMGEGHGFLLLVADTEANTYMEYRVVFTNLPVIHLEGGFTRFYRDGRALYRGTMTLFDPSGHSIQGCPAAWQPRGAATSMQPKKSWKLELLDGRQQGSPMSLLDLGEEDDWILNSMSLDDTCMKEKLTMDVWNELAEVTPGNYPMSEGRYVEVVCAGEYTGLYLLQRRVDEGYLQLEEDEILMKGYLDWAGNEALVGYEVKHSPLSEAQTQALMADPPAILDVDNFIDTYLFVQWGAMLDNRAYKNMYYILQPSENGYSLHLTPWDTDLSMGVWFGDNFEYQPDISRTFSVERMEYEAMKLLYEDFDARAAARWKQLREGIYDMDSLTAKLEAYRRQLTLSGAYARNRSVWPEYYGGQDTYEAMCQWLQGRTAHLDTYFSEK